MDLRILNLIVVFLLMASAALAHHGKDYMEIEEYSTPERGEYLAFSLFEYHTPGSGALHYWKLEPGALFGVTDNVALEAHLHLTSPEGASMAYESTALEARFQLAGEDAWVLSPAASVEYEFSADGVPDVLTARFILAHNFGDWNVTANYWGEQSLGRGANLVSNYGLGVNHRLFVVERASLELFGTVGHDSEHYLLPSLYVPLNKSFAIKAGAAFGLTDASEDLSLRGALHLMF